MTIEKMGATSSTLAKVHRPTNVEVPPERPREFMSFLTWPFVLAQVFAVESLLKSTTTALAQEQEFEQKTIRAGEGAPKSEDAALVEAANLAAAEEGPSEAQSSSRVARSLELQAGSEFPTQDEDALETGSVRTQASGISGSGGAGGGGASATSTRHQNGSEDDSASAQRVAETGGHGSGALVDPVNVGDLSPTALIQAGLHPLDIPNIGIFDSTLVESMLSSNPLAGISPIQIADLFDAGIDISHAFTSLLSEPSAVVSTASGVLGEAGDVIGSSLLQPMSDLFDTLELGEVAGEIASGLGLQSQTIGGSLAEVSNVADGVTKFATDALSQADPSSFLDSVSLAVVDIGNTTAIVASDGVIELALQSADDLQSPLFSKTGYTDFGLALHSEADDQPKGKGADALDVSDASFATESALDVIPFAIPTTASSLDDMLFGKL